MVDDRRLVGHLLQLITLTLLVFSLALVATGRLASGFASLFLGLTAGIGWFVLRSPASRWASTLGRLASLAVALLGLASIQGWLPELLFWNLLVPLLFFLIWPVRWATGLTLAFVLAIMTATGLNPEALGMLRHQLVPVLLLVAMLTGLFVYLREIKARQLAPLRRADTLTQASSQEHLKVDLHTEIQRSEREGTALAVMQLALDPAEPPLPAADQADLLRHLGRLLHEHLRSFDLYYRTDDTGFIVIFPGMETAEAMRQAESIRLAAGQSLKTLDVEASLSASVAGLNVGDTVDSLLQRTGEGLARAQTYGGSQVQSWTAPDGPQHTGRHEA